MYLLYFYNWLGSSLCQPRGGGWICIFSEMEVVIKDSSFQFYFQALLFWLVTSQGRHFRLVKSCLQVSGTLLLVCYMQEKTKASSFSAQSLNSFSKKARKYVHVKWSVPIWNLIVLKKHLISIPKSYSFISKFSVISKYSFIIYFVPEEKNLIAEDLQLK
jgi:hypothetical protein